MPEFYPLGSLAEHCVTWHGFPVNKTVTDAAHRSDHAAHDRAVAWMRDDPTDVFGRLSAVLPIGHPYEVIGEQEVLAA
jgi:hypothetical protein